MLLEGFFHEIVKEVCKEENIRIEEFSYGYIKKLKKQNKTRYIIGNNMELNSATTYLIATDKNATYQMIKNANIPVVENEILFNPKTKKEYVTMKEWEDKKWVVKPNTESGGKDVYLCQTKKELENKVEDLFQKYDTINIGPFYDTVAEYRIIYLQEPKNNPCKIIYKKQKPFVVGDGISTVKQLIAKQGIEDLKKVNTKELMNLEKIPLSGEKVEVLWKYNLSTGAIPQLLEDDKLVGQLEEIAKKVGEVLNVKFASIDILQTKDGELLVLEVNPAVCMQKFMEKIPNGYEIAKEIYREAIQKMFQE